MSQTSYGIFQGTPFAGLLAEDHPYTVLSKLQSEASANVATGVFVKRGTTDDVMLNMAAAADLPCGVTLFRPGVERFGKALGTGALLYAPKERVDICEKGRVWVRTETDIAISLLGASLFIRVVANGAGKDVLGAITKTSDTTNTRAAPPGIRVIIAAAAAGVALLEFDNLVMSTVVS